MMIVGMILSSLALLAAVANIILFSVQKKREAARRQAMLDYISNMCDGTLDAAEEYTKTYTKDLVGKKTEELESEQREFYVKFSANIRERFELQQREIDNLKNGACPDYEKALAAANAVNDFNAGISAIMNFDPIAAAKARRQSGDKEVS